MSKKEPSPKKDARSGKRGKAKELNQDEELKCSLFVRQCGKI